MTSLQFDTILSTPLGYLGIKQLDTKISKIEFLPSDLNYIETNHSTISAELAAYFQNPKHIFTLTLHLIGTPFQIKVWEAIKQIPAAQTLTYQQLAEQLKTSPRAIGNACRANPIPIIIPCHRVIAKNHLGGYAGAIDGKFMDIKKWLLKHEAI